MSTVRSSRDRIDFDIRHSLGFVAHPKRLNGKGIWSEPSLFLTYHCDTVAITRARGLLIIIGDPKVLSLDQVWNEFLHYVRKMGGWRGVDFELPELDDDDDTAGPTSTNLYGNMPSYDYELPIRESD
jgi:helicase MOV-10